LLNSVPRLDSSEARVRLDAIEGLPPDLGNLPGGCSFAPRCKFAADACISGDPVLREVESKHHTACIRVEEIEELSSKVATG